MRKSLLIVIVVLLLTSVTSIWASGGSDGGDKGSLTVYGAVNEDHLSMLATRFEEATGIKTSFVRLSAGEILARLKAEKNNMSASVWYGGPSDTQVAAMLEGGILVPYESPEAANIPDQFKDKDGYWTGIYVGYLGFDSNKKLLAEKGASVPQSWQDLLKPAYKGEIVVAHPGSSGTAYTMLSTVIQLMGEDKGMEYMKKLNGQIRQYTKSGSAPARMVGSGEAAVGITFLHDGIKYIKEGYVDMVLSAPSEGTGYEIGAVSLLNGPDQEQGKVFIDWVLSKEVQEMAKEAGSFQFLTNKNATPPAEADQIKDTKLIDYDFQWAGENRVRLVEKFSQETSTTIPTQ